MNSSADETHHPLDSILFRNLSKTTSCSLSLIVDQNSIDCKEYHDSDEVYEKGRHDMLVYLCENLKKNLGIDLPMDSPSNFMRKLACILVERPCLLKFHAIQCQFQDLIRLHGDLERIMDRVQRGESNEGRVKISNLKIDIKVQGGTYALGEKQRIARDMAEMNAGEIEASDKNEKILELEQEIKELKWKLAVPANFDELELMFIRQIQDLSVAEEDLFVHPQASPGFVLDMTTQKYKKQQEKLIQDKDWEKQETINAKTSYHKKKQKLELKSTDLSELEKQLKKKNLDLEREKHEVERLKEAYHKEKKRVLISMENKCHLINDFISTLSQTLESQENFDKISPITETDLQSDASSTINDMDMSFESTSQVGEVKDSDMKYLQQHLAELEQLSKTDLSEDLIREMDAIRNRISKIRSSQAIKSSLSNQKKFDFNVRAQRNSLSEANINFKRLTVPSATPKAKLGLKVNVFDFSRAGTRETTYTPKASSQAFNFGEIMGSSKELDEEENALKKIFRVRELKLKEREDELDRDKEKSIDTWKKLPMANELIPMVQKEILELKAAKEKFRRKCEMCERKEVMLVQKIGEMKRQQRELQEKQREVEEFKEKLDDDKTNVVCKLQKLKSDIEKS